MHGKCIHVATAAVRLVLLCRSCGSVAGEGVLPVAVSLQLVYIPTRASCSYSQPVFSIPTSRRLGAHLPKIISKHNLGGGEPVGERVRERWSN